MTQTLEQIRLNGLKALRQKLGRAGMIRFLQQFDLGRGDYAKDRHAWVDRTSLEDLRRPKRPRRRPTTTSR
ncbi:MAG TPA: hypothetical protein VM243_01950 [Phycisphaerae bacterium]|nr:hypothetical protein [Phycisphaerae bacterium]